MEKDERYKFNSEWNQVTGGTITSDGESGGSSDDEKFDDKKSDNKKSDDEKSDEEVYDEKSDDEKYKGNGGKKLPADKVHTVPKHSINFKNSN